MNPEDWIHDVLWHISSYLYFISINGKALFAIVQMQVHFMLNRNVFWC